MNRKYVKSLLAAAILVLITFAVTACTPSVPNGTYKLNRIDVEMNMDGTTTNAGWTAAQIKAIYEDGTDISTLSASEQTILNSIGGDMVQGMYGTLDSMSIVVKDKELNLVPNKQKVLEMYAAQEGWDSKDQTIDEWVADQGYDTLEGWYNASNYYSADEFDTITSKFTIDSKGIMTLENKDLFGEEEDDVTLDEGMTVTVQYKNGMIQMTMKMTNPDSKTGDYIQVKISFKK